jgi:gamma-glutamyltranspeptidase/glutathione hydrolase
MVNNTASEFGNVTHNAPYSMPATKTFAGKSMKSHRPTIMGTRHMIAATQYLAAEAGFKILEAGGNAIDAGVGCGIALGVVQPEFVNVAGVAPIIIYSAADDRIVTIPGLGTWPKALDRN